MVFLAAALSFSAHASNGIDEDKIQYHDWHGAKPNVVTMISSKIQPRFVLSWHFNASWRDSHGQEVEPMQKVVCNLVNRSMGDKCTGTDSPAVDIRELFLGTPDAFKALPAANEATTKAYIGVADLANLPPGAKRVLQVAVMVLGQVRTVISVAYDNISDDDLRTIALEDGIYRAATWRSN
jgi:hypothetical protein